MLTHTTENMLTLFMLGRLGSGTAGGGGGVLYATQGNHVIKTQEGGNLMCNTVHNVKQG